MSRTPAAISVLVVEDEVMISNLVGDCLSESGFRVHEVATADEALRYFKSGANVDVLFTDINLPGGMNGAELAEWARELRPEMPIVSRGATSFPKYRRWCRARCSSPSLMTPTISARC